MHLSAIQNGQRFFDTYVVRLGNITIIDIGAQDVNGSLRTVCPKAANYVGVDFTNGRGVDIILDDPYKLPFNDNSIDVIVSSSCFEHSKMFWLLFLEIIRALKPGGLFYLNAPSIAPFHRYPVDCYRFFPDSGDALAEWGRKSGFNTIVLEHYTCLSDYICVFLKDAAYLECHPYRIMDSFREYSFGGRYPHLDKFKSPLNDEKDFALYAPHLVRGWPF